MFQMSHEMSHLKCRTQNVSFKMFQKMSQSMQRFVFDQRSIFTDVSSAYFYSWKLKGYLLQVDLHTIC